MLQVEFFDRITGLMESKKLKTESFPRKRESIMACNDWIPAAVYPAHDAGQE